jgi:hypothetical protein
VPACLWFKLDRLYQLLKQFVFVGFEENLGNVQVNPETVDHKLGVHVLLLNRLTSKGRYQHFEVTNVSNLRRNKVLRVFPGRIAQLPHHVAARLAVFAITDRLDEERNIQVRSFVS